MHFDQAWPVEVVVAPDHIGGNQIPAVQQIVVIKRGNREASGRTVCIGGHHRPTRYRS